MTKRSAIAHSSTQLNGSSRHFGSSSYLQSRSRNKGSTRNAFSTEPSESSVPTARPQNPFTASTADLSSILSHFAFYSSAMHKCGIYGMGARLPRVYYRNSRILRHKEYFHSSSASLCVQWEAFDERRRPRMRPSSFPPLPRCHIVLRRRTPLALRGKPSCQIVRCRPFPIVFLRPLSVRLGEDVCACASTATWLSPSKIHWQ